MLLKMVCLKPQHWDYKALFVQMVNLNVQVEILVVNFHQEIMDVVLYQKLFVVQMVYIVVRMDIHVLMVNIVFVFKPKLTS